MGWIERLRRRRRAPLHIAIDKGHGPVVVLVHGIASSSVTFEKLIPRLVDTHRVVAIDLLGFGESPAPADATFTIEEHETALAETIRSLRLRAPFVLVGHSMGSLISSRYAATHPRLVSKLILVSPPVYVNPTELGDPMERATMGLYLKAYEFLRGNERFTIRTAAMLSRMSPIKNVLDVSERNWTAFVYSLERAIESQTAVSDIARVRAPIEVVWGTLDPFLSPAGLNIIEQMRHVTMHRIEGGDHLVRKRVARVIAAAIG